MFLVSLTSNCNGCFNWKRKNLGEIAKFSTIDKCCATSLGTVEVEGTTSGAAPTSKTWTKFKESHVPYNLFCPLKLNLGDLKQKQNTWFFCPCLSQDCSVLPHPMLAHLIHVKKDLGVICVSYVLFAQPMVMIAITLGEMWAQQLVGLQLPWFVRGP